VPSIPPKKAVGNKDAKFIFNRRYFLERFFKQISSLDFLLKSEQLRIFTRPQHASITLSIEKQFYQL